MYPEQKQLLQYHFDQDEDAIAITIPSDLSDMRLDVALATIIPELSRNKLINWIKNGLVLLNNHSAKPKDRVVSGDNVIITPSVNEAQLAMTPENIPLNIVYEDADILVINKPSGLTVHPGNGNPNSTLLNGLLFYDSLLANVPRAGIVHRLDKDTTGLMVIAKNLLAQTNLVRQLQDRTISRIYHALVMGKTLQTGVINANIGRDPHNRIKMAVRQAGNGKEAITHYTLLQYFPDVDISYIECKLETGRTHQIRVHCQSIGHPLIGDKTYGATKSNKFTEVVASAIANLKRQALHAIKLSLQHPVTGKMLHFTIPLAADIEAVLSACHSSFCGNASV